MIGTGATGVQCIPIIAKTAAELTVFQRTANYVLPGRNYIITADERQEIRANYDQIWDQAKQHFFGFAMDYTGRTINDVDPEEAQKILEGGWERAASASSSRPSTTSSSTWPPTTWRRSSCATRSGPSSTNPLRPSCCAPPRTTRSPASGRPLGHFYYEAYNRPNVHLVDVSSTPISAITPSGIRVGDDEYEVDVIVFATGFDAVTGSYVGLDVRGRGGVQLADRWQDGPRTHLGIGVDGFPNMFMVCGPQSPFANIPVVIDGIAEWIGDAVTHLRDKGLSSIEPVPEAVEHWRTHMDDLVNATVLTKGKGSWFLGKNIPGKTEVVLFYFGGAGAYRGECREVAERGYDSFVLTPG